MPSIRKFVYLTCVDACKIISVSSRDARKGAVLNLDDDLESELQLLSSQTTVVRFITIFIIING